MADTGNIKYSGNSGGGLDFESQLWATADKMRGHKDASEYKHVCLDLIISNIGFNESAAKSKDVLGRVYEYFLGKFASAEGKGGGEFYTPQCVVQVLVAMLEPYKGRVFDPCCGSGGMFVSSEKFVEEHGGRVGETLRSAKLSCSNRRKRWPCASTTTWKLARKNLAIRGIDANLGPRKAFDNTI
jgi:type I restriction enzyme M protein